MCFECSGAWASCILGTSNHHLREQNGVSIWRHHGVATSNHHEFITATGPVDITSTFPFEPLPFADRSRCSFVVNAVRLRRLDNIGPARRRGVARSPEASSSAFCCDSFENAASQLSVRALQCAAFVPSRHGGLGGMWYAVHASCSGVGSWLRPGSEGEPRGLALLQL